MVVMKKKKLLMLQNNKVVAYYSDGSTRLYNDIHNAILSMRGD